MLIWNLLVLVQADKLGIRQTDLSVFNTKAKHRTQRQFAHVQSARYYLSKTNIGVEYMKSEFRNEPFTDFTKEENAQAMRDAIAKVKTQLGREYPLVIGGARITTEGKLDSMNPANRTQVIGRFNKATKELATRAVDTAYETFKTWRKTPAQERAELLFRVGDKLRERKHEMSAWMIYEVAKTWAEADGDTAEAIDFCEFYGREMLRYAGDHPLVPIPGEENILDYVPLRWRSHSAFPLRHHGRHDPRSSLTGNTVVLAVIRRANYRVQVLLKFSRK